MKKFKITYRNNATGSVNSVICKYSSLEVAQIEEAKSMAMFRRVNPSLELVNVEAI